MHHYQCISSTERFGTDVGSTQERKTELDWPAVSHCAFIVTYLENRCKLTLDGCVALFPAVEIFQAVWF